MYGIYCVSKSWGNHWCLDECSAPIKAGGRSQGNATSTPKGVYKRIRTAKAALIGGAEEQSQIATEKAVLSGEKLTHSLSTSGLRRRPLGGVAPVAVPRAGLWSQPQTSLGATLCQQLHAVRRCLLNPQPGGKKQLKDG